MCISIHAWCCNYLGFQLSILSKATCKPSRWRQLVSVFCADLGLIPFPFQTFTLQVYKSASKRKAHILKNHPGAELPPSIRKLRPAGPGEPDPMLSTHTQLTGTIATPPVCCPHCSKQYSSKVRGSSPSLVAQPLPGDALSPWSL